MGVVYLARQTGLDRPVALKMLKAGMLADEEDRSRFAEEARIVARLRHPNIVQLYECGAVLDCPYVALEFVDGPTLSRFLDETPQSAAWAAELVEQLARAMQYAHEQGVVHRDLKPANILLAGKVEDRNPKSETVTQQSRPADLESRASSFQPKVSDFGLAKILGDSPIHTQTGFSTGTPGYMAPEQVRGDRDQIGPWTDVYALGVILYECLTGRAPFSGRDPAAAMFATTSVEPPPPRSVRSDVPHDLETVCLKCLAKKPEERYLTAAALAADLSRFRDGRSVLARRAGPVERTWKFVRRNPIACALATALMVSLTVGFATASVLYFRAEEGRVQADTRRVQAEEAEIQATAARVRAEQAEIQARDSSTRANEAADLAKTAQERAEADRDKFKIINEFVVKNFFERARPVSETGKPARPISLYEVILQASPLVLEKFAKYPDAMSSMDQTLGVAFRHLGDYEMAEMHLKRAVAAQRILLSADDIVRLQALNSLGVLYLARNNLPAASDVLRETIRAIETMSNPTKLHRDLLLTSRQNLGNLLVQFGKGEEAVELLEKVLAEVDQTDGVDSRKAISTAVNLSRAYHLKGQKELAHTTARDAIARAERGPGAESQSAAGGYRALVDFQENEPPSEQAAELCRRNVTIHIAAYGPDHPHTILARQNLVNALYKIQRFNEILLLIPELYETSLQRYGPGSDFVCFARRTQIAALGKLWRFTESITVAEELRTELVKQFGPSHKEVVSLDRLIEKVQSEWDRKRLAIPAALGGAVAASIEVKP